MHQGSWFTLADIRYVDCEVGLVNKTAHYFIFQRIGGNETGTCRFTTGFCDFVVVFFLKKTEEY